MTASEHASGPPKAVRPVTTQPASRQAVTTTESVLTVGDGSSQLRAVELDAPEEGELILALEGCGLCGTDLFKIQQRRSGSSQQQPIVLGHELIGRVAAKGAKAPFAIGQRLVVAHHVPCGRCHLCERGAETNCPTYQENLLYPGGFSNQILIRARAVSNSAFPAPDALTAERAIFLEPTACVLRSIRQGNLPKTPQVVIFGCGSMGLLHLLALRALHPDALILAVDPNLERRSLARALGAQQVLPRIDALGSTASPETPTSTTTASRTGSFDTAFDTAFDTVGSGAVLPEALSTLRPGGTVVLFAHGKAKQSSQFSSNLFFRAEHRIVATYSSGRLDQVRAFALLCGGAFCPEVLVTHKLPLDQFEQAIQLAEQHRALKIMLTPTRKAPEEPKPINGEPLPPKGGRFGERLKSPEARPPEKRPPPLGGRSFTLSWGNPRVYAGVGGPARGLVKAPPKGGGFKLPDIGR